MIAAASHASWAGLRGVLFDLDDTLFDHTGAAGGAVWAWVQGWPGWPHDRERTLQRWRELEIRHFARYRDGELTFDEQRRQRVREFAGGAVGPSDAALDAAFAQYLARYEERWAALPDAVDVIGRLLADGYRVGVLTNGQHRQQRRKLDRMGLSDSRLVLLAADDLPAPKPAPSAFAAACRRLGLAPGAVLMVGDDLTADVEGALTAGLRALHLRPGPAALADRLPALPDLSTFTLPRIGG